MAMDAGFAPGPVMVAVDDDPSAEDAVEWAAAEGSARRSPLVLVHPSRPQFTCDLMGISTAALYPAQARAEQRLLQEAQERAWAVASDLEVFAYAVPGSPSHVLPAESRAAALLVLGWGGGRRDRPGRSPAARVLTGASCPVVVVRPRGRAPQRTQPRVVVGVGRTPVSAAAVGFAFRAARQRGIPLVAVHAWSREDSTDLEGVHGRDESAQLRAAAVLDRALAPWRRAFPDVPVEGRVAFGDPAAVLVRDAHGAALVVVGGSARRLWRTPSTSVSRRVVRHATSPVAVVRPDVRAGRAGRSSASARRDVGERADGGRGPRG
jgi:nucleotide-binding universal stress UspA family protein